MCPSAALWPTAITQSAGGPRVEGVALGHLLLRDVAVGGEAEDRVHGGLADLAGVGRLREADDDGEDRLHLDVLGGLGVPGVRAGDARGRTDGEQADGEA